MRKRLILTVLVLMAPLVDRTIVQELGPHISSLRILDVGCATGRLLERLAEAGATQLFGVDLAPRILEVAAEKLSKTGTLVDLRTADAEDCLPWDHESFDAITLTGVLHHFFRPRDALAEVRRVLPVARTKFRESRREPCSKARSTARWIGMRRRGARPQCLVAGQRVLE